MIANNITFLTPLVTDEENSNTLSSLMESVTRSFSISEGYYEPVDVQILSGFINKNGTPQDTGCFHTDFVPVVPGEKLKIYAYYGWGARGYAFYGDRDYSTLKSIYPDSQGSVSPEYLSAEVTVPAGSRYAVASYASTARPPSTRCGIWKVSNTAAISTVIENAISVSPTAKELIDRTVSANTYIPAYYENVMAELSDLSVVGYIQGTKILLNGGRTYVGPFERFKNLYVSGGASQYTRFMLIWTENSDGSISAKSKWSAPNGFNTQYFLHRFHMTEENLKREFDVDNVLSVAVCSYGNGSRHPVFERGVDELNVSAKLGIAKNESRRITGDVFQTVPYTGQITENKAIRGDDGKATIGGAFGFAVTENIDILPGRVFTADLTVYDIFVGYSVYDVAGNCISIGAYSPTRNVDTEFNGLSVVCDDLMELFGTDAKSIMFCSKYGKLSSLSITDVCSETYETLSGRFDGINEKLQALSVNAGGGVLFGKRWLACGDSFTAGDFSGYVDPEGKTGISSDAYDPDMGMYKTYPWWICKRNLIDLSNVAACGGTMHSDVNDPKNNKRNRFCARLQQLSSQISCADYITFMYGINEQYGDYPASSLYDATSTKTLATLFADISTTPLSDYGDTMISDINTAEFAAITMPGVKYGEKTDATPDTIWGSWNITLSAILSANPDVKLGIIFSDGSFNRSQYDTQKAIAEWWGIPILDLKNDPYQPPFIGGKLDVDVNPFARSMRSAAFRVTSANGHPGLVGHSFRSTIIENFLRSL